VVEDKARDNLKELFGRFVEPQEAAKAAEEIQRGQRLLELYPAPQPDDSLLAGIKQEMCARLNPQRRWMHRLYRLAPAAAAVILIALLGPFARRPASDSGVSYASLIPTAIWESGDINTDDAELAYFNAEIEQIEAQIRQLQTGDDGFGDTGAVDDLEVELIRIESEFWRE
jgi:hypothetical protein